MGLGILGWLVAVGAGATIGFEFAQPMLLLIVVALVIAAGRLFRGPGEPMAPPRPWWRLTGGAPSSIVWAVLFGLSAVSQLIEIVAGAQGTVSPVVPAAFGLIAVAYAHSAARQRGALRED